MILDVSKDGEVVESIELSASKRVYNVGRQAGVSDIVLTHSSISRDHATITISASGTVVVMDMGSAQGTRVAVPVAVPASNSPSTRTTIPPRRSVSPAAKPSISITALDRSHSTPFTKMLPKELTEPACSKW